MAAVLEFRSTTRRPRRSPVASYGGGRFTGGEVVIFPGVRVEREGDSLDLSHRMAAAGAPVRAGEPADEDA